MMVSVTQILNKGHTEEDGLNVSLNADNENCNCSHRTSVHNYLHRKLLG
jgi:hypothetical protein